MTATITAKPPATSATSARINICDRIWRTSGIAFVLVFILTYALYGSQPHIGAPAGTLTSFYDGHRMQIMTAAMMLGLTGLLLVWFALAVRNVLADEGRDGSGGAAIASSAATAAMLWLFFAPDGAYTGVVSPGVAPAWAGIVSLVVLRRPATRTGW